MCWLRSKRRLASLSRAQRWPLAVLPFCIAVGAGVSWLVFKDFKETVVVSVLLVEVIVLVSVARESVERSEAMRDLQMFRRAMGRSDYMRGIESTVRAACTEMFFTSASMERSGASPEQATVVRAVEAREGQKEKYVHRGIVARRPAALAGGIELCFKTRVEIRVSEVMNSTHLRFAVGDVNRDGTQKYRCVLGLAEGRPESVTDKPSSLSIVIESTMLGLALRQRFEDIWAVSTPVTRYLDEHVRELRMTHARYSLADVREFLHADETGVTAAWLVEHSEACFEVGVADIVARAHAADARKIEQVSVLASTILGDELGTGVRDRVIASTMERLALVTLSDGPPA